MTLSDLIERLEALRTDLSRTPELAWAVPHVEDLLDDCRDVADLDAPLRSGRAVP
jgi:hypothetical protein